MGKIPTLCATPTVVRDNHCTDAENAYRLTTVH